MRAGGVRDVARVALFDRHGDELAAVLEHGARPGGGELRVADPVRALGPARAQRAEIGGGADLQARGRSPGQRQAVQIAGLLIDDAIAVRGGRQHREVGVRGDLAHGFGARVVREQIELAEAVGPEIDRVADPLRADVVRARRRLRDLLDRVRLDVVDIEDRVRAAAIPLPLQERLRERVVDDLAAVGRVRRGRRVGNRQLRHHSAGRRHREELRVPAGEHMARRREQDTRPVRRETLHEIHVRMPRKPRRNAARHGDDEDVGVAVVLRAERQHGPVGRERGIRLRPLVRCQPPRGAAVEAGHPQVAAIDERDVGGADRRLREQSRVGGIRARRE